MGEKFAVEDCIDDEETAGEFESNRVSNKEIGEYRETIWGGG